MPTGFLGQLALQTASQAAGAGIGMALQKQQDKRQLAQQGKLLYQQQGYNKEMTEFNRMQALKMWEDTNYKAQMEQLKKAGLNPGLLYGMSGGGGTTANVPQGQTSSHAAPAGGGEIGMGMQLGLQSAMQAAQIENIKAQTENTKADTANKPLQGKNIQEDTILKKYQGEIAQVQGSVLRQTIKEQMTAWENIAAKGTQEITNMKLDADKTKVEMDALKSEIALNAIKGALTKAQTTNTNQDTKNKIQEILESETRMKTMAGHLQLQWAKMDREGNQDHSEGANDDWNFIKELVPGFLIPIGRGFKGGHTPIKGFQK